MKISTDLFELVKSLNPSEKRYFHRFCSSRSQGKDQTYLQIFGMVDAMEVYDEKLILEQLGDDKLRRQFPVLKNYLYRLLLKSLRTFHSEQTIDFQIKELLQNCELLADRGLVNQALKQVDKAERLALKYDRFGYFGEIGSIRIALTIRRGQGNPKGMESEILRIHRINQEQMGNHALLEQYRLLSLRLLLLNRQEAVVRGPHTRKAYTEIINDPLLADVPPRFSIKAQLFYFQSHFIFQIAQGDFQRSYTYGIDLVKLMEENEWLIAERPENYLAALQNVAAAGSYAEPLYVVRELLEKLLNVAERFPKIKFSSSTLASLPRLRYHIELRMLIQRSEFDEAEQLIPKVKEVLALETGPRNINEGFLTIGFYQQFIHIYLHQKKLELALETSETIINDESVTEDYEIHLNARILRVVTLFEMGAESRLDSAMLSLYRFLKKKDKLYDFERALFDFIRRASRDPSTLKAEMEQLKHRLKNLKANNGRYATLMGFDLEEWLQVRIQRL